MTIISKYFQSAQCNPLRCADCETICATVVARIIFTADERNNAFGSLTVEAITENQEYRMTYDKAILMAKWGEKDE